MCERHLSARGLGPGGREEPCREFHSIVCNVHQETDRAQVRRL